MYHSRLCAGVSVLLLFACTAPALAQKTFEVGGFFYGNGQFYSRRPNPPDTYALGTSRFQLWSSGSLGKRISWRAAYDLRIDTHNNVDRTNWLDFSERGLQQPAGSLSELYVELKLSRFDFRVGRQEIRWGRADGYNPTDNLIPYDYLDTTAEERIAVPAVKADGYFGDARLEFAWIPSFTPTRLPLMGQRWFPTLPSTAQVPLGQDATPTEVGLVYTNGNTSFPALTFGNGQWGVRWNQIVPRAEFSFSYFDGFDDIAIFSSRPLAVRPPVDGRPQLLVALDRSFYRLRVAGADFATSIGPFGLRGEVAYYDQSGPGTPDHVLVVAGLDRSWGDWFAVVEYADLSVAGFYPYPLVFPDLALKSTVMWRVTRTMGPSQSVELSGSVGLRDGGVFVRPLYKKTLTNRWSLNLGATFLAGPSDSYIGQYRRNDSLDLQLRCAF